MQLSLALLTEKVQYLVSTVLRQPFPYDRRVRSRNNFVINMTKINIDLVYLCKIRNRPSSKLDFYQQNKEFSKSSLSSSSTVASQCHSPSKTNIEVFKFGITAVRLSHDFLQLLFFCKKHLVKRAGNEYQANLQVSFLIRLFLFKRFLSFTSKA